MASVSAIPGGMPARPRAINHRPDPVRTPGLVMVGDYLFDSTVNGVLDSADVASDIILTDVLRLGAAPGRRDAISGQVLRRRAQ